MHRIQGVSPAKVVHISLQEENRWPVPGHAPTNQPTCLINQVLNIHIRRALACNLIFLPLCSRCVMGRRRLWLCVKILLCSRRQGTRKGMRSIACVSVHSVLLRLPKGSLPPEIKENLTKSVKRLNNGEREQKIRSKPKLEKFIISKFGHSLLLYLVSCCYAMRLELRGGFNFLLISLLIIIIQRLEPCLRSIYFQGKV